VSPEASAWLTGGPLPAGLVPFLGEPTFPDEAAPPTPPAVENMSTAGSAWLARGELPSDLALLPESGGSATDLAPQAPGATAGGRAAGQGVPSASWRGAVRGRVTELPGVSQPGLAPLTRVQVTGRRLVSGHDSPGVAGAEGDRGGAPPAPSVAHAGETDVASGAVSSGPGAPEVHRPVDAASSSDAASISREPPAVASSPGAAIADRERPAASPNAATGQDAALQRVHVPHTHAGASALEPGADGGAAARSPAARVAPAVSPASEPSRSAGPRSVTEADLSASADSVSSPLLDAAAPGPRGGAAALMRAPVPHQDGNASALGSGDDACVPAPPPAAAAPSRSPLPSSVTPPGRSGDAARLPSPAPASVTGLGRAADETVRPALLARDAVDPSTAVRRETAAVPLDPPSAGRPGLASRPAGGSGETDAAVERAATSGFGDSDAVSVQVPAPPPAAAALSRSPAPAPVSSRGSVETGAAQPAPTSGLGDRDAVPLQASAPRADVSVLASGVDAAVPAPSPLSAALSRSPAGANHTRVGQAVDATVPGAGELRAAGHLHTARPDDGAAAFDPAPAWSPAPAPVSRLEQVEPGPAGPRMSIHAPAPGGDVGASALAAGVDGATPAPPPAAAALLRSPANGTEIGGAADATVTTQVPARTAGDLHTGTGHTGSAAFDPAPAWRPAPARVSRPEPVATRAAEPAAASGFGDSDAVSPQAPVPPPAAAALSRAPSPASGTEIGGAADATGDAGHRRIAGGNEVATGPLEAPSTASPAQAPRPSTQPVATDPAGQIVSDFAPAVHTVPAPSRSPRPTRVAAVRWSAHPMAPGEQAAGRGFAALQRSAPNAVRSGPRAARPDATAASSPDDAALGRPQRESAAPPQAPSAGGPPASSRPTALRLVETAGRLARGAGDILARAVADAERRRADAGSDSESAPPAADPEPPASPVVPRLAAAPGPPAATPPATAVARAAAPSPVRSLALAHPTAAAILDAPHAAEPAPRPEPSRSGVDALRAGIAVATAGGGRRVRLARIPGAADAADPVYTTEPGETVDAPAATRSAPAPHAATNPTPDEPDDADDTAAMIAALPAAVAALRSPAVSRMFDTSHAAPSSTGPIGPTGAPAAGEPLSRTPRLDAPSPPSRPPAQLARTPSDSEIASEPEPDGDNIDELYDRLAARLRADLLDDRERRGDLLGRGPR
jgi:hypothetical protein